MKNWSELQTEFWNKGYAVIDELIPVELARAWGKTALTRASDFPLKEGVKYIQKKFEVADDQTRDAAGVYNLVSIDGFASMAFFDGLGTWYDALTPFLSLFTGLDVVTSEDVKSAVTVMAYPPPAGQMLAHYDTNALTMLLYFTDNEDGGTEVLPLTSRRPTTLGKEDEITGPTEIVLPRVGRAVIMQGRRVWHRAMPVAGKTKVSSAWNYYVKGDFWRPEGVSKRLY